MKRFVLELVTLALKLVGVTFVGPLVISVFAIGRENAYMLFIILLIGALIGFQILMLPLLRFVWMIRRQERTGVPFQADHLRQFDASMTHTYLTEDWLIHAGYVALHRSRITYIQDECDHQPRFGWRHRIFVVDADGYKFRWQMSKASIHTIFKWWKDGPETLSEPAKEK